MGRKQKYVTNLTIRVPVDLQEEYKALMESISKACDLAKIHNTKLGEVKHPERTFEYILSAQKEINKVIKKLEPKTTKDDFEKLEARRKYLREYYRGYKKED